MATTALLVLTLGAGEAHAAKRIVVLGVRGVRGEENARLISRGLRRRFSLVSAAAFVKEAKARGLSAYGLEGRSQAARALRVAGVVSGSVRKLRMRWMLRLSIYSGHNGQPVGSVNFPMRGTRLDHTTLRRVISSISNILARTKAGPPLEPAAPAPRERHHKPKPHEPIEVEEVPLDNQKPDQNQPPPPPPPRPATQPPQQQQEQPPTEEFDDGSVIDQSGGEGAVDDPALSFDSSALDQPQQRKGQGTGFTVPDYSPGSPAPGEKKPDQQPELKKKDSSKREDWESIIEGDVGLLMISRSFNFNAPVTPADPADYTSGLVAALQLHVEGYPLALLGSGPLAGLGLSASYFRVIGLESQMASYDQPLATTLHEALVGVHYRWNILSSITSPVLKSGVGFGFLQFAITWPTAPPPLPNTTYQHLDLNASLEWPYYRNGDFSQGASLDFLFLYALSAGPIEENSNGGYGKSMTTGIQGGASLFAAYKGFTLKLHGFYRRIGFKFDATCASLGTGCNVAGGALDVYIGAGATVGYVY